jgi:uncharacterized protein with GYD domain
MSKEGNMSVYFLFGKYSTESVQGMSAERTEQAGSLIKKYGGTVKSVYALMGDNDLVVIADFPGIEEAMKGSLAVSKLTGISFSTSPAVPVEDFDRMIGEL